MDDDYWSSYNVGCDWGNTGGYTTTDAIAEARAARDRAPKMIVARQQPYARRPLRESLDMHGGIDAPASIRGQSPLLDNAHSDAPIPPSAAVGRGTRAVEFDATRLSAGMRVVTLLLFILCIMVACIIVSEIVSFAFAVMVLLAPPPPESGGADGAGGGAKTGRAVSRSRARTHDHCRSAAARPSYCHACGGVIDDDDGDGD